MKRTLIILLTLVLLAAGAVCAFRWKAWFGMPAEPTLEDDIVTYDFTPLSTAWIDRADTMSMLVLGDVHNDLTAAQYRHLYEANRGIVAYAQLGDWLERPYFYYEQALYRDLTGSGLDGLPVLAITGNHECAKSLMPHRWSHWDEMHPDHSLIVDMPGLRWICIHTQELNRLVDYTRALTTIREGVRTADGRWTVVAMHHPIYSCAKGRANPMLRLFLKQALDHTDLVLSGHDHLYSRRGHYVTTNASSKAYPLAENVVADCVIVDRPVYERLTWTDSTLVLQTYALDNDELLDDLLIDRQ